MKTRRQRIVLLASFSLLAAAVTAQVQTPPQAPRTQPPVQGRGAGRPQPADPQVPPVAAPGQPPQVIDPDQYKIGPEDVLDISVWKNPDLTRTVTVRPDGRISVPLLNDLQASGLTPLQLRDILTKNYSAYQPEPEVAVIVKEIHSIKVSVLGMVKTPGRYELR